MYTKQQIARAHKLALELLDENSSRHGMRNTPEWGAYRDAKKRCTCPTDAAYKKWYGSRGIRFRFRSFKEFFNHIGPRPSAEHSLDRINNDGNYEIGNVKWSTRSEQARNRRRAVRKHAAR